MAEYTYDPNGNRTSYTNHGGGPLPSVGAAEIDVDDQDRLLRYGDWHFTYNRNGEMLTKGDGATTFTFAYDPLGTLTGATASADGATTTIAYVIDAQGRRVGKKVGGDLIQGFLYLDAINPVAELDGNNDVVSVFVYATKGHVPDYMVKPSGPDASTYRIVTDHLGSVRLVVDVDSGDVLQRLDYDEYGNVLLDTHPGFQPFAFAGGLYDRDTGLVRFGVRDYDPVIGRWTTKDPIGFTAGTNLYAYLGSDSVNGVDPSGLGPDREL